MFVDAEYYDPEDVQTVQEFKALFEGLQAQYLRDFVVDWEQAFAKISNLARSKHRTGRILSDMRIQRDDESGRFQRKIEELESEVYKYRTDTIREEWADQLVQLAADISGNTHYSAPEAMEKFG